MSEAAGIKAPASTLPLDSFQARRSRMVRIWRSKEATDVIAKAVRHIRQQAVSLGLVWSAVLRIRSFGTEHTQSLPEIGVHIQLTLSITNLK